MPYWKCVHIIKSYTYAIVVLIWMSTTILFCKIIITNIFAKYLKFFIQMFAIQLWLLIDFQSFLIHNQVIVI